MNERDRLIDDILNEVSANRGVPYEKRALGRTAKTDALVDAILAETNDRETNRVVTEKEPEPQPQLPSESEQPVLPKTETSTASEATEKPVKTRDEKKAFKRKKKKEQDDLLATITPWDERHGANRGITAEETARVAPSGEHAIEEMTGVKNSQSFFQALKKSKQPVSQKGEELLYKKGDTIHPQKEEPAVKEVGLLSDLSTKELTRTIETASKQVEDTYEPTRMVPTPEQEEKARFRPHIEPDELTGQVRLEGFDKPDPEPQPKAWESEFIINREDKIKQFTMTGPADEEAQPQLTYQDDGEYHSVEDATPIKYDLLSRSRSVTSRLWSTLVLLLITLALTIVNTLDFTNGLLSDNPALLLGLYTFVLLVASVSNIGVLLGGLKALFTGCDQDTPAAIGLLMALIQGGVSFAYLGRLPNGFSAILIGAPALLGLVLNLWGKRMMFLRMYRNLELIGNQRTKYAVTTVNNKDEAFELGRGLAVGTPNVVYPCAGIHLKDFIYHSYAPDAAQLSARLPMLLFPLFGLLGAAMTFLFCAYEDTTQLILQVVSGFVSGVCISAPACVLLSGNVPFARFCKRLYRYKVMLSGYDAVEEFKDTDVLTVDASQLFPAGSVVLKSIKSASNQSLDRSIMDVAGVVYTADCPLKPLFEKIIQGQTELLPEVDTLVYEEEMGISGWVMGYRVLVGTKKLMETHGVLIPDEDYEEKYREPGLKAVYLSTQGILSAVFLVKYTADEQVQEGLRRAVDAGLSLHIYSCDPNITREMVCHMFDLPAGAVRIMGAVPRRLFKQQTETNSKASAVLSYEGDAGSYCRGVTAAIRLHKVIRFASILQTVLSVIGIAGFCAALYLPGVSALSGIGVLLYQLATTVLVLGLPALLGR